MAVSDVEFGCNTIEKLINTSVFKMGNVEATEMKAELFLNCIICNRSARSHFHFKNSFLNLFHPTLVALQVQCSYRFLILCRRFIGKKQPIFHQLTLLKIDYVYISLNFATCSTKFS